MRSGYQLYGPGQLAHFWEIAANGKQFPSDYRDALRELAARTGELRAPVYFQVPESEWSDPRWQELVKASRPQCRCPVRRVLVPGTGRARLVPREVPTHLIVAQRGNYSNTPTTVLLMPHGGDADAAQLAWSFQHEWPTCTELPLQQKRPHRQSISFGHGSSPDYANGVMRFDFDYLVQTIRRRGEVICYQTMSNGNDRVTVPVCSIVGLRRDPVDNIARITIEIDASMAYQFVPSLASQSLHLCVD